MSHLTENRAWSAEVRWDATRTVESQPSLTTTPPLADPLSQLDFRCAPDNARPILEKRQNLAGE